jgi:methylase of polypeptide subunit release factors
MCPMSDASDGVQEHVGQGAGIGRRGHEGTRGLTPPVGRRARIQQSQAARRGCIPWNVAVPEDKNIGAGKECVAARLAPARRACLVDHREAHAVEFESGDLRQPGAQLGTVVVAVDAQQAGRSGLERVERRGIHPVAGVEHDVAGVDLPPERIRQPLGSPRQMGIRHDQDARAHPFSLAGRVGLNGRVTHNRTDLVSALRADLGAAGFTVSGLSALWGPDADAALHRNQRVPAVRALRALRRTLGRSTPAATLAELFVLGLPVSPSQLSEALPTLGIQGAAELRLVSSVDAHDESVRPAADLRPYSFIDQLGVGSWWIVSDLGELSLGHAVGEDHVLGVGGASLTLSGLMLQRQVENALDLGTGCGIQAMHAARHARRVIATDISQRALEIAELNAALNGFDNIEFRLGSLFDPVAGETFDQIVSNPPFVITPRAEGVPSYEYRDGGMIGDALVRHVLLHCGEYLAPGGVAQFLGNWEYTSTEAGLDRVRGWFDEMSMPGLDAWVIERDVQHIDEYAETWIRDGGTTPASPEFDRLYGAWLNDFESRDVTRVGFGYLMVRRSDASGRAPLRRLEQLHGPLGGSGSGLGAHLATCLEGHDWQADRTDEQLRAASLVVAADVTIERHYWPGDDDPTAMTLRQGGGFGRSIPIDTGLAALVGACDGELTVGAVCGALAQLLDVSEQTLTDELIPLVRGLIDDAVLLPPADR